MTEPQAPDLQQVPPTPEAPLPPSASRARRGPRDRDVLMLLAAVVILVLIANLVSAVVPGMDQALAVLPILVVVLIVATLWVLYRALRPR